MAAPPQLRLEYAPLARRSPATPVAEALYGSPTGRPKRERYLVRVPDRSSQCRLDPVGDLHRSPTSAQRTSSGSHHSFSDRMVLRIPGVHCLQEGNMATSFHRANIATDPYSTVVLAKGPVGYWRLGESGGGSEDTSLQGDPPFRIGTEDEISQVAVLFAEPVRRPAGDDHDIASRHSPAGAPLDS